MTAAQGPVSGRVLAEAIEWMLRLEDQHADDEAQRALQHWLAANPEHALAWQQLGGIDRVLAPVRGAPVPRRRPSARRLGGAALAVLLTVAGGLMAERHPPGGWLADAATGSGEHRHLVLPDHSSLHLNGRTAVDVEFDERERRLYLRRGEILIETADSSDPRPFVVETAQGRLRALGTRFVVREEAAGTRLIVLRSAVAARPSKASQTRVVEAGQQLLMQSATLGTAEAAPAAADAWSRGMLVVEDMPLAAFVDRLGDYRAGHLGLDDRLRTLRITGSFPLDDTDRALTALSLSLPVRIERHTDWWVRVVPADG